MNIDVKIFLFSTRVTWLYIKKGCESFTTMARPYLFHSLKSLKTTMGSMMTAAHTAIITQGIVNRHTLVGTRNGLQTRLEDAIVDTLSKNTPNIYVHWGVHLSGKHRAA
jgi:hypothetical protein